MIATLVTLLIAGIWVAFANYKVQRTGDAVAAPRVAQTAPNKAPAPQADKLNPAPQEQPAPKIRIVTLRYKVRNIRAHPTTSGNMPLRQIHLGQRVETIAILRAQDPYQDGRDLWVQLKDSTFMWAGSTNATAVYAESARKIQNNPGFMTAASYSHMHSPTGDLGKIRGGDNGHVAISGTTQRGGHFGPRFQSGDQTGIQFQSTLHSRNINAARAPAKRADCNSATATSFSVDWIKFRTGAELVRTCRLSHKDNNRHHE